MTSLLSRLRRAAALVSLVIPANAGLRRQDAEANICVADGPKGERRISRVSHFDLAFSFDCWQSQTGQAFRRTAALFFFLLGCRQTGQAFLAPAGARVTFLLAQKSNQKMRPWRVGRAEKPHDVASWLRGSLKAHPCTCSELAESIRPPWGRFLRQLASPNRDEGQQHAASLRKAAALRRMPLMFLLIHPPVPVGKCWTEKPLAGRAMDCASSAAAQDVPSAEPGQCLCSRAASPHVRKAIGTHLLVTFLCEQKSDSAGGSRKKCLTRLAVANHKIERGSPAKRLTSLAKANKSEAKKQGERECAQ